jgi:hypothetical protein
MCYVMALNEGETFIATYLLREYKEFSNIFNVDCNKKNHT